jgi:glycosyltransferase involved in cell wall biosynthesis
MRIAWFSPLPPSRSGIAAYSADVLARLVSHEIEAFVDDGTGQQAVSGALPIPGVAIRGAHEFVWRRVRHPYDLVVYHVGNDRAHDYLWPYLVRYPGLVVLHDAQLHQARAQGLIRRRRQADYKAEFTYSHPEASPTIADLIISGLGGPLVYLWPMVRIPVEAARLVAVHNLYLARDLEARFSGRPFQHIHLGVPDPMAAAAVPPVDVRRRHGIPGEAVIFGSFGRVTPEKGLTAVLRALAQVVPASPDIRLLVAGGAAEYFDLMAQARELGVAPFVIQAGYVPDEELPAYLSAVDVCLNLRWPTGRETSAAWIRCLAAGKPTIVTDLVHQTDVPSLDLRSMEAVSSGPAGAEPVCAHIELIDEIHMLRLALRRLAEDGELRARLGRAARRYWAEHATLELMAADYESALARAAASPLPRKPAGWPTHLSADGSAAARSLVGGFGVPYPLEVPAGGPGRAAGKG